MTRPRLALPATILAALVSAGLAIQRPIIPSPEEFLGHRVGAEKKLARWDRIVGYMQAVARGSQRVRFEEIGKSTEGNPFILVVVSSADNLQKLDRYREINRRLFDPRTISSDAEAADLIRHARIFVLATCSIHATEVGAAQMSMELVHRLAVEDSALVKGILDNVIFLLVPSLNPDGQVMVTDWYNKTLGTAHEDSPLPWLYHRYTGHDNNRDAFMFTQQETRLIGRVLYRDWLPAIWLDEHQMGSSGPRIFVMPAMDPINPNVDPVIYRHAGLLGFAQAAALEKAGKEGILYGEMYTYWWEGAMAWTGWWHNMIGMLTEVASARIATPIEQEKADPGNPRQAREAPQPGRREEIDPGRPLPPPSDIQSRSHYPRPWLGGRWTLRDIVDYELIATVALLESAGRMREPLLEGLYIAGKRQVETGRKGDPYAVIVPADQPDRPTVLRMLEVLSLGAVEIHRASKAFLADGNEYPAGTYLILMAQPFRAYAKDLLEPQIYPKISPVPGAAPRPPYDAAGWSLGLQMGVESVFVRHPFDAAIERMSVFEPPPGEVLGHGTAYITGHEENNSLLAVNRMLRAGHEVLWLNTEYQAAGRQYGPGAIVVYGGSDLDAHVAEAAKMLGIDFRAVEPPLPSGLRIRAPRVALYQPWGGSIDEGWTRWILEQFEFPFETVHPQDLRKGALSKRFDAVLFPDMSADQILNGLTAHGVPEQYRGGIGDAGVRALRSLLADGGSLITLGRSTALAIDRFAAPYRDALGGLKREEFFCPGSILRVLVDRLHPIGFGMPAEANAYFSNSMALEAVPSFSSAKTSVIARYPNSDLLRSGWLQGDSYLQNRVAAAEVRFDRGRLVLLPLRVQHRAQTHGTFKLLFNAILTSRCTMNEL